MATQQIAEDWSLDRNAYAGVLRFYELAKKQEWQGRDMPWGELPPIPETKGAPPKVARRRDMWRAEITEEELLRIVAELNDDDSTDGILVQLPLPDGIDEARVIAAIDPVKDVD